MFLLKYYHLQWSHPPLVIKISLPQSMQNAWFNEWLLFLKQGHSLLQLLGYFQITVNFLEAGSLISLSYIFIFKKQCCISTYLNQNENAYKFSHWINAFQKIKQIFTLVITIFLNNSCFLNFPIIHFCFQILRTEFYKSMLKWEKYRKILREYLHLSESTEAICACDHETKQA